MAMRTIRKSGEHSSLQDNFMYADVSPVLALPRELGDSLDTALLDQRLATHPEAFAELYGLYLHPMYRYLRARTKTEEEAADLTQQVFLQAFTALPRFRSQGVPAAAWLFRIARNVAIDAHRRRRVSITWDHLPEALQPSFAFRD
jgi:RNA polymerase sigma-70 factor, ECF subfamily